MNKTKIVAALIVKNESELLARCLDSVKGVDDIYIVDTGSEDNTIEIAKRYTDHVYDDFTWCDNFAKARNHVMNKVPLDRDTWILSIDADEFLHDFGAVREAVEKAEEVKTLAVDVCLIAESDGQKHWFPRLFKRDPQVWWEAAVHNHINVKPGVVSNIEITYGYSPAHQKDPNRALRILKAEYERTGNARETFYLGREYWYRQDFPNCIKIMEEYVSKAHFMAEKADALVILARCYWACGRGEDARHACMEAIMINPNFAEAVQLMAVFAGRGSGNPQWEKNGKWWTKAAELCDNAGVLFIRT